MLRSEFGDDLPVNLQKRLEAKAQKIHNDYNGIFQLLAVARDLVAHSQPIDKKEHTTIGLYQINQSCIREAWVAAILLLHMKTSILDSFPAI